MTSSSSWERRCSPRSGASTCRCCCRWRTTSTRSRCPWGRPSSSLGCWPTWRGGPTPRPISGSAPSSTPACSALPLTAGAIGISSYLTKFELSRAFFVLLFLVGVPLLLLWRWSARRIVHRLHRRGRLLTKVIISGSESRIDEVASVLRREKWLGFHIIGALVPSTRPVEQTPGGVPVIGFTDSDRFQRTRFRGGPRALLRGRLPVGDRLPPDRLGPRGSHVQMAVVPSLSDIRRAGWPCALSVACRSCTSSRRRVSRPPWPEARLRPGRRHRRPAPRVAGHAHLRGADQAAGRRSGALPPDPRRPRRAALRVPQVPQHGRRCGGPPVGRQPPQQERRGRPLQGRARPADHACRSRHPPVLHRRAAAADQRHPRRHEPRRAEAGPAGRGPPLRHRRPASTPRATRADRPLAGLGSRATSRGRTPSASTSTTSTTGRSSKISRSWLARSMPSSPHTEHTESWIP